MNALEVEDRLKKASIIIDTREQATGSLEQRCNQIRSNGYEVVRKKLDCGDYGIEVDGEVLPIAIERKYDLTELCTCFCRERSRFVAEFERAKENGIKMYLLIENASWEKAYSGQYRSQMSPSALTASMFTFMSRYGCQIIMCNAKLSGKLIIDIIIREAKEYLRGK